MMIVLAMAALFAPSPVSAASVQALKACVAKKLAQVPGCIRKNGKGSDGPCRTGIYMEMTVECTQKLDPENLHEKEPARRQILFDACIKLYNPNTGQTAEEECNQSHPSIGK
jgi:hypothetical protein